MKATLSNLPNCCLSLFKILQGVPNEIERLQKQYLWRGQEAFTPHYIKWNTVSKSKEAGRLALDEFQLKNCIIGQMALEELIRPSVPIGSSNLQRIWAGWKCLKADNVKQSSYHSPWKGIVQVLPTFIPFSKLSLGSGNSIRFWLDPWICTSPLDSWVSLSLQPFRA